MPTPQLAIPPQTAESNLTYTPPPEPDQAEYTEFKDALHDSISEIENEYNPTPEFVEDAAETTETAPQPEAVAEVEPEEPAIARGMERLVAREVALQAKEAAFQAREARVQGLETELATLRTQLPAKDVQERLYHSPSEALKAMGHDPEAIVRLMIAEQLEAAGKPVPPELKEFVKDAATQREIKALRAQVQQNHQAQESAAFFNAVALGAREYVKTVDSKALPTLAGIAKANPDRAHREIMEEITADARVRLAADPNGQPMTYQDAAKRVETRLAELKSLFGPVSTQDPTKLVVGKPATPPQQKPPVRPLKPWEKKGDDLLAQGLAEAEREFQRMEAQNKRR